MKKIFLVVILLLLSFWTVKPLFHQGFFNVHDNVQVERVYEMGLALKDGQFPVRWVKDLGYGYGYPIFNFYSPLPYYVGGLFTILGMNALLATKLMMGAGILLAAFTIFVLAKRLWGVWGGLLSAVLYVYSPYHALDIYVRGAVGEFWAMAFLPLVFLGMYEIFKKNGLKGIIIGTCGVCGVVLSHNLTAFMIIPFMFIFFLVLLWQSSDKKRYLINTIFLIFLSSAISAFYWLPALLEMNLTNVYSQIGGGADFHKNFIALSQIWDFPWGFGGSAGLLSGMSFKIGKPNILLMALAVLFGILINKKYKVYNDQKSVFLLGVFGFLLSVFLTNKLSQPIWELIKPMAFIQYPWRFLEFSVFFSSLLSGFVVLFLTKKMDKNKSTGINFIIIIIIIFVIAFHSKYFVPQQYLNLSSDYYTSPLHLKWEASKISDEYLSKNFPVPKFFGKIPNKTVYTGSPAKINDLMQKTDALSFRISSQSYNTITLAIANFPGWKVWVDNKPVLIADSPYLIFTVSKGEHKIEAAITNTAARSTANLISLLGIAIFGVILAGIKYEKS
ncbi:MAG: 6-pyruvoyl-tetrahydropterin synthase-related protein [Patescibacteria group bacterium]|nr:6-pyruvoyl-tetrahydropterin synthase-related protein [Patescibacteria group bacterium]